MKQLTPNQLLVLLEYECMHRNPIPGAGLPKRNRTSAGKSLVRYGYLGDDGGVTAEGKAYLAKMATPLEWGERCPLRDPDDLMTDARKFASQDGQRSSRTTYGAIIASAAQSANGLITYIYRVGTTNRSPIAVRTASMPRWALNSLGVDAPAIKAVP